MIHAALLFTRRLSSTTTVSRVTEDASRGQVDALQGKSIPSSVTIYRIRGPFLPGATEKLTGLIPHIPEMAPVVILRLRNMTAIDATGLEAIDDFADKLHDANRTLLLCDALRQPAQVMNRAEFHRHVGERQILPDVGAALARARDVYDAVRKTAAPVVSLSLIHI